jgi:thioredoxin 1
MVSYRVLLLAGVIASTIFGSFSALAAEWRPFSAEAFAEAQKQGKSILVDISAPWCPTCRAQKPILEELTVAPEYRDLLVLKVDFDNQKSDVRALNAQSQSTLIAFRGSSETARSVGDTNADSIAALVKSAL